MSNEMCQIHSEKIDKIQKDVEDIKDFLIGTLEKKGYVTRLVEIEKFKNFILAICVWTARISLGAIIVGVIGYFIKTNVGA